MINTQYTQIFPTRYFSKCLFCPREKTEIKNSNFFKMLGMFPNQFICDRCDFVNVKKSQRIIDRMLITQKIVDK